MCRKSQRTVCVFEGRKKETTMKTAKQAKIDARNEAYLNSDEFKIAQARHELQKATNAMNVLAVGAPLRYQVAAARRLRAAIKAVNAITTK